MPDTANIPANALKASPHKGWTEVMKYAIVLAVIACCVYANTLVNGFVYDDIMVIKKNELVTQGISAIPTILITPYHQGNVADRKAEEMDDLYRPLSLVLFAIGWDIFGDSPLPGHLVNVLLYGACIMLFFLFLYHLFRRQKPFLAFVAALLFAVHPLHTEVVANIKSSDELLCFLFAMLALNSFIKYLDTARSKALLSGLAFYFLSLLSKETSITFLAIIPLVFFFFRTDDRKKSTTIFLLSLAVAATYLALRYWVLTANHAYKPGDVQFVDNILVSAPSASARFATAMLVLGNYLRLMVAPWPLICDYGYNTIPYTSLGDVRVLLSLVAYVFIAALGIYRLRKKPADPLAFGILFYLFTISIFTNILFLVASVMSERFVFFASAGFCIAVAYLVQYFLFRSAQPALADLKSRKALFVLLPVALIFASIAIFRNTDWHDNYTLFKTDSRKSPDNFRLYFYAGNEEIGRSREAGIDAEIKRQLLNDAVQDYRSCIAIYPDFSMAQKELGLTFLDINQPDSAEVYLSNAHRTMPGDTAAYIKLADVFARSRKYAQSMNILKKISAVDPTNPNFIFNVAVCNIYTKQYDSAIHYLHKALAIDPRNNRAIKFIAVLYNTTGQTDSARKYEDILKQYDPTFSVDKVVLPK